LHGDEGPKTYGNACIVSCNIQRVLLYTYYQVSKKKKKAFAFVASHGALLVLRDEG
jgi:hypothetical protein